MTFITIYARELQDLQDKTETRMINFHFHPETQEVQIAKLTHVNGVQYWISLSDWEAVKSFIDQQVSQVSYVHGRDGSQKPIDSAPT